jgi:hypothetical protein
MFSKFLEIKNKKIKRELEIIKKVLESKRIQVESFLNENNPYLFVKSSVSLPFDGIRIYKIGSNIAYRIQNENKTEPYGKSYPLDIESVFSDLITDMKEEEAGKEIIELLNKEISNFFKESEKAQQEISLNKFQDSPSISINNIESPNKLNNPRIGSPF